MTTETTTTTPTTWTHPTSGRQYLVWQRRAAWSEETQTVLYRLDGAGSNTSLLEGRQYQLCRSGEYGPLMAAYVAACEAAGLPVYAAWRGVINSMGDHAEMTPPWTPRLAAEVAAYAESMAV